MAFLLENVVPWGRTLQEYRDMFLLTDQDLRKKIVGFADGPASFNCEARKSGLDITSVDVIYQFTAEELQGRIEETREIILEQTEKNKENFNWDKIRNIKELESARMGAMNQFLEDYNQGKKEKRYIFHEFPAKTSFADHSFDLGLCSHFLFLYSDLGLDFHLKTIDEMLRICKEVRISPTVDLDGNPTALLDAVMEYYKKDYTAEVVETSYAFLKTENQFLRITANP